MRGFESHDDIRELLGHLRGSVRIHLGRILFDLAAHSGCDDIQEREYTSFGPIDDTVLEIWKIAPTGATRVCNRRDAAAERETVRVDAVVAVIDAAKTGSGVDVRVNVHQAWRHD